MLSTNDLWNSTRESDWQDALREYWSFVKPTHMAIEKEIDSIDTQEVANMNAQQWFDFLLNKYFYWKYTEKKRYVTTTYHLKKYLGPDDSLDDLFLIKEEIFSFDKEDIATGLKTASKIKGLGTAGASGLLAVLFPSKFGTVDQFAVKALSEVHGLPEESAIAAMSPEKIRTKDGVVLIRIMRRKANELNTMLQTGYWSARKVDMVLWSRPREKKRQSTTQGHVDEGRAYSSHWSCSGQSLPQT
jgi:hypothetical protein